MPEPMVPEPTIPTRLMFMGLSSAVRLVESSRSGYRRLVVIPKTGFRRELLVGVDAVVAEQLPQPGHLGDEAGGKAPRGQEHLPHRGRGFSRGPGGGGRAGGGGPGPPAQLPPEPR